MTEQTREPGTNARPRREADAESWLLRTGLSLSVWILAAVATVFAATGQVELARWAGITDASRPRELATEFRLPPVAEPVGSHG